MQTYRIIPTKRSDHDLEEIAQHISQDSPEYAERLVDQILKIDQLASANAATFHPSGRQQKAGYTGSPTYR